MPPPKVSVLTTAYNREKYLAECIESVLASSFLDYEYIIVDDASGDESYEIALAYAKKDPRIRVYRNEKNLGDYANRNRAASYAIGTYLKYIDADDYLYPHGLEIMAGTMERFPEAGLGLASLEPDKIRPFPFQLSPTEAYQRHYFVQPLFHKAPLSSIMRRDSFLSAGGFSGKRYVGDFEFWHIMAARYPVVLMPQGVVWYWQHLEQEMELIRGSCLIRFEYLNIAVEQLTCPKCPLPPKEQACALRSVRRAQARVIVRNLTKGECRWVLEMLRSSKLTLREALRTAFRDSSRA